MKKIVVLALVLVMAMAMSVGVSARDSATADFEIIAEIVEQLTVEVSSIDFGTITNNETHEETAEFDVFGGANDSYTITLDDVVELKTEDGDALEVNLSTVDAADLNEEGEGSFGVTAELTVDDNVAGGSYTGDATVTVEYAD